MGKGDTLKLLNVDKKCSKDNQGQLEQVFKRIKTLREEGLFMYNFLTYADDLNDKLKAVGQN